MPTQFPTQLDGFATRLTGEGVSEVHANNIQDAIRVMEKKVGKTGATDGTTLESKVTPFFAAGRKVWMYEDTAAVPTGWVAMATSDVLLAVKGGGTYTTGGTTAGVWAISGFAHGHAAGSYYFNDIHYHGPGIALWLGYTLWYSYEQYADCRYLFNMRGSNKNFSGSLWSGGSQDGTWRPLACVGLIIKKT